MTIIRSPLRAPIRGSVYSALVGPWAVSAGVVVTDPYFANVVLLCGFDGVDGAITALDESTSAKALTFNDNAQLDTAQAKFGSASLLCDGNGDFVSAPDSADWNFTGQFTVECWFRYPVISSSPQQIIGQYGANGTREWVIRITPGTTTQTVQFTLSTDGSAVSHNISADANTVVDTWYHVAADRDASNNLRLYVNGVMIASKAAASGSHDGTAALTIGRSASATFPEPFNGWIDEARVTKGVARYASDAGFTPPATAFPRS